MQQDSTLMINLEFKQHLFEHKQPFKIDKPRIKSPQTPSSSKKSYNLIGKGRGRGQAQLKLKKFRHINMHKDKCNF